MKKWFRDNIYIPALWGAMPALVLVVIASAVQGPEPIPPHEGEDHQGQPEFCQNYDSKYLHNCDCQPHTGDPGCKEPDKGGENPKCSVYCRKNKCGCKRECERTTR
jgi:hypothetical protein